MSKQLNVSDDVQRDLIDLQNNELEPKTVRKRASAILSFAKEHITRTKIARSLNVRVASVCKWVKDFLAKGIDGIKNKSGKKYQPNSSFMKDDVNNINDQQEQDNSLNVFCESQNNVFPTPLTSQNNKCNNMDDDAKEHKISIEYESFSQNHSGSVKDNGESQDQESCLMSDSENTRETQICVSITLKDGNKIIQKSFGVKNILPNLDKMDYSNKSSLESSIKNIYHAIYPAVISTANQSIIEYANASLSEDNDAKKSYFCQVGTLTGLLQIQIPHSLRIQLATNERLYDPIFLGKVITLCSITSIREAADIINTLTFNNDIKSRTLGDLLKKEGKKLIEKTKQDTINVLTENGFDPDNGELIDKTKIDEGVINPTIPNDKDEVMVEKTLESIENYNDSKNKCSEKIDFDEFENLTETHPDYTVTISADYVDAWKQKEHRVSSTSTDDKNNKNIDEQSSEKQSKRERHRVRQATIHVTSKEGTRVFVGETIMLALLNTLAYLLNLKLLINRELIFFTDGAKDVNNAIKDIFKFRPFKIKLDWFHLVKKCYEFLSMALYGGKTNKENNQKIRSILKKILFVGHVEEAKNYLDTISSKCIKDKSKLEELKSYLDRRQEYIYCYAIRKSLNLINSSNLAETFNNLCVSLRCKSESKSWSQEGVNSIAAIRSLRLNREDSWFDKRELKYAPVPPSQSTMKKINKLNEVDGIIACA